jgi:hypothetical protein
VGVEGLRAEGRLQPAIFLGQHYDFKVADVEATSSHGQALGALPVGPSYPLVSERCKFSGADAGVVLFQHLGEFRSLQVPQAGVGGVRAFGGDLTFDRAYVWRLSAGTDSVFRFVGHTDGGNFTIRNLQVDNEELPGPGTAVVDFTAGTWKRGALTLSDLQVARVDAPAAFVRLDSLGLDGGNREPYQVRAEGLRSYTGCPVALRVDGGHGWEGSFDATTLAGSRVVGDPAGIAVKGGS